MNPEIFVITESFSACGTDTRSFAGMWRLVISQTLETFEDFVALVAFVGFAHGMGAQMLPENCPIAEGFVTLVTFIGPITWNDLAALYMCKSFLEEDSFFFKKNSWKF